MAGRDSKMRITTQLVRVKDDVPLWTGNFDRHITDALAIEQEIARAIANALRWKFGRGTRRYAPEAYDLYLRARAAADVRFPGDDDVIIFLSRRSRPTTRWRRPMRACYGLCVPVVSESDRSQSCEEA